MESSFLFNIFFYFAAATPSTSSSIFSGGSRSSQKSEDRVNILSDQDVVEYNPNSVSADNDFYQQKKTKTKAKKPNMFDDI